MTFFELSDLEEKAVDEWRKGHECSLRCTNTTIGGKIKYSFTPTGLGVIVAVECTCGAKLDLSEYDKW